VARMAVIGLMAGVMGVGVAPMPAGESSPSPLPPFCFDRKGHIVSPSAERGGGPEAGASVRFYDSEGRAGVGIYTGPELSGKIGLEDGSLYTVTGFSSPRVSVSSAGIPFWWETTNPWSGTVRGWGRSAPEISQAPRFVLPAPASEVGFSIFKHAEISGLMTMGIYVSLVDKLNTPSPLIYNYMSYSGRTSVVTAVYLPGNALSETVGLESHEFDQNDLVGDFPAIYWGSYQGLPIYDSVAPFAMSIPTGPVLVAATFDGSTTEMIEINGIANTYFEAELPFAPLPGSTLPTAREMLALGEPPAFVLGPSLDAVMLRDSIDLVTDLDYHCDRNHDGVLDAADYLLCKRVVEAK
jgi:hypothetical protein